MFSDPRGLLSNKYSTEYSPSWQANSTSASQEIPRILPNRKVHYRVHNSFNLSLSLFLPPSFSKYILTMSPIYA